MKFLKLKIRNFSTIGEAVLELDDRGLLLIQGVNEDDPSAESNGAGKSSIVDALCWANYGVTARGISGDAVVNKTAKKDCLVEVTFQDSPSDDFFYMVRRHRKDSVHKNQLMVSKHAPSGVIDLSKGTEKETQDFLTGLLGCSLEVFMAAVYMGQEQMTDLPGMTDKMLKSLIEEAAGVEVLTQAYAVARERWTKAKSVLDLANSQLNLLQSQKIALEADLATMLTSAADFDTGRRDRAKAELSKALPINGYIAACTKDLAAIDIADANLKLANIKAQLDAHDTEKAKLDALVRERNGCDRDLTREQTLARSAAETIQRAEKALAEVESHIGTPCSECGKEYHAADLATAKEARQKAITAAKADGTTRALALRAAKAKLDAATKAVDDFKMADVSALVNQQANLQAITRRHADLTSEIANRTNEVSRIKADANVKLTEPNPWEHAVNSKRTEVMRNADQLLVVEPGVKAAQAGYDLLTDAVKVFGPAGVRAHVLDTVTPYLNERTRDYLGALADGNIHATWSTLSKTAKGELKEKFNIEVVNDKGADSFAGMSGGEKRKARLATSLALQDLVASRATKPIGLWIGDEIDHALDDAGLERLMGVLERKARDRGTVLVISHNALDQWCSEIITVTKNGGKASVTGAVAHGI